MCGKEQRKRERERKRDEKTLLFTHIHTLVVVVVVVVVVHVHSLHCTRRLTLLRVLTLSEYEANSQACLGSNTHSYCTEGKERKRKKHISSLSMSREIFPFTISFASEVR